MSLPSCIFFFLLHMFTHFPLFNAGIYDLCIVKTTPAVSTSTTPKTGGGDGGVGGGDDDPATSPTVGGGDGDVEPPSTPKAAGGVDEGASAEPGSMQSLTC